MLPLDASLKRNAMWLKGSQARNSSSPTMPPRILTVLVVPTPRGSGLVHVTSVIAVAQCGHDSASASTSNNCSGVMVRSTVLTNRYGASAMKSRPTRSHAFMAIHGRARCLPGAVAGRRQQGNEHVADGRGQPVRCRLTHDHAVTDIPFQRRPVLAVGED